MHFCGAFLHYWPLHSHRGSFGIGNNCAAFVLSFLRNNRFAVNPARERPKRRSLRCDSWLPLVRRERYVFSVAVFSFYVFFVTHDIAQTYEILGIQCWKCEWGSGGRSEERAVCEWWALSLWHHDFVRHRVLECQMTIIITMLSLVQPTKIPVLHCACTMHRCREKAWRTKFE